MVPDASRLHGFVIIMTGIIIVIISCYLHGTSLSIF